MSHSQRLKFLFDRYVRLQCSNEEVEELVALLQQADVDETLAEPMRNLWDRLKEERTDNNVDWENMYSNISTSQEDDLVLISQQNTFRRKRLMKIAASIIILVGIAGSYFYFVEKKTNISNQVVSVQTVVPKNIPAANQTQTIHLPDGSTVILNAESKLNYPSSFAGTNREVYLTGEGYFDIKHNTKQPFLVHTGKITIRVLGTAFDIKAYPLDKSIEVTVTRGKVQVLKENKSLGLITANQQISFSKNTEEFIEKVVDTKPILAWKPTEIIFNDMTMLDAAKKIELRFNTTVEFANTAIKDCRVTATFSEDDMLEEMLTVICGVTKTNYTITKNKVVIDGKGCGE